MPRPSSAEDTDPLTYAMSARDRSVMDMVREALDANRYMLAFQPVIGASTGETAFHEGLIRILDDTGRIIPAGQFMGVVEALEIGRRIDCAALRCGLGALSRHPRLRLAINMSARSVGYPNWLTTLNRGLARDPTCAERLILEITEESAMQVPELVQTFMSDLMKKGVTFALDDFGAGHTSFRHLRKFYFDILKIDGSFVRGCDTDPDNQCLLEALVTIGRKFDMFTVAEAVETKGEADFAASIGIDCMQGYYYGAPEVRPDWFVPPRGAKRAAG